MEGRRELEFEFDSDGEGERDLKGRKKNISVFDDERFLLVYGEIEGIWALF